MSMGLRRQASGVGHPVQAHHQRLALDLELGGIEAVDDVLDRQAGWVFRQDVENEVFDVVGAAACSPLSASIRTSAFCNRSCS